MSGLDIALALPGVIDLCLKYGKIIITAYKDLKNANQAIEERKLTIETSWIKTSQQLTFLRRIWDSLGEEYQDLQGRILRVFEQKLEAAVIQLSKLEKQTIISGNGLPDKFKAAKYALLKKESLEKAIQDLQSWQNEFDTTWFLVMRLADHTILKDELVKRKGTEKLSVARHVLDALQMEPDQAVSPFLSQDKIHSATRTDIPRSTSKIIEIAGLGEFILDSADCSTRNDAQIFAKNVRHLAMRLHQVDANGFHLLKCHGVARITDPYTKQLRSFDFIFNFPDGCHKPRSLRSLLLEGGAHSLSDRVGLAKQLATAINYIHVLDFVHKNIRPETVLVFEGSGAHLGPLYLLGFRAFRLADNKTLRLGNSVWSENAYEHPDRQGSSPEADYVMQHDIYSLGVCLLEIGLWESFVSGEGHANALLAGFEGGSSVDRSIKDYFMMLAKKRLPSRMGEMYTQVVVNCLSCMDEMNEEFGDQSEFEDDDGILIGVKYVEKVLLLLNEITV
ncbi:hypothetical protein BO94DRAFT_622270 [Aspergillus sclerotioniger CBS 115572]|uniref:Protein kinase domain-containing protein n=1 Tax=Aspergillus sclerotioniger CBS 115572 TaxID=1450535 RepID=A0A317X617_9EURO|nr:hypothetical protein BO94DRAFT_622270 [Aspergillus sclerotioniger CBS 115572]PWY93082.1 hypothetical protein BO94DRAFT_622270 [Aspergillus sclerotioniger CBS 115572]